MKKFIIIMLVPVLLLGMGGCGLLDGTAGDTGEEPEAVDYTAIGTGTFESRAYGVRFQYPVAWAELSPGVLAGNAAAEPAFEALLGLSEQQLSTMLGSVLVYVYNTGEVDASCVSNLNLMCTTTSAETSDELMTDDMLEQLKTTFEGRYGARYNDFAWARQPSAETYGGVPGIYQVFTYSQGGDNMVSYQFITANAGTLYTFTYTTSALFAGNSMEQLLDIFSSIQYLDSPAA